MKKHRKVDRKEMITAITFEQWEKELMSDPEFLKVYEARRPMYELKSALRDARIKGELTQVEIAKKAGTTQSAIARFESGRTAPTLAFMQRLAEALGKRLEVRVV
jgi:DNA-binding XRE family transcriptional regulator